MKINLFRNRYVFFLDAIVIIMARIVACFMLFPEMAPLRFPILIYTGGIYLLYVWIIHFFSGIYNISWQYSDAMELMRLFITDVFVAIAIFATNEALSALGLIQQPYRRLNMGVAIISTLGMILERLFIKELFRVMTIKSVSERKNDSENKSRSRVLIIGAGDAAGIIIKNLIKGYNSHYEVAGLIDDDESKQGKTFFGYKVLGGRERIVPICRKYEIDYIMLAIPSAYTEDRLDILRICNLTKCKIKTIPSIEELIESHEKEVLREVQIDDLLERDPIKLDNDGIRELVSGQVVMVSGGGGSIGSELCRQIMKFSPERLVIVDIYENNAYDIQMELNSKYPDNQPAVLIASVRDRERLDEIFEMYKPSIVFHAAAHKHVPLMETSPAEAIKNNVFGTYNLVNAADKFGVKKFVMISTDKAVNPTNVMGASKRLCEMIVQCKEKQSETEFVAVRFGNVLGSNGSVIPLFKKQIAHGGPVKVTHKDVTRFFMTIPEAAQLVIQAACYAKGGEVFVLDMGKPVKIYDLAENLIRLSGYTPGVDIEIEIVGLRPGEKLYEELLMDQEGLEGTKHSKIFIGRPLSIGPEELENKLELLKSAIDSKDNERIRDILEEVVPTYIRDNEKFNKAHQGTS